MQEILLQLELFIRLHFKELNVNDRLLKNSKISFMNHSFQRIRKQRKVLF